MRIRRPRFRGRASATEAFAVRLNGYGETSAVAVLATRALGRVQAVAKGAKRLSNSFLGPLDKGVLYRVRLARRGAEGLYHLHSATVLEPLSALRRDPARFLAASFVIEVAADLLRDEEPHDELFRLTVFTLKVLDRAPPGRVGLAVTLFLARALALSGHVPEIGHCVACGRPLDEREERPLLAPGRGGVLHSACARGEPGARSVGRPELAALRRLWRLPAAELLASAVDPGVLGTLRRLLEEWLQHVLERGFRSAAPMEREIGRAGR